MMGGESINGPMINLCNSIVGVSVLAMPFCFSKCGAFLGALLLASCGLLTMWTCKMAIRAAKMTRSHSYETLALAVFGKPGKLVMELSIIGINVGSCIAFFVIIGDLVPSIVAQVTGSTLTPETLRALVLILTTLCVIFPLTLLRNISSLKPLSTVSLLYYVFLITLMFFFATPAFTGSWSHIAWWDSSGILKCLPIFALAYACHPQMFSIYSAMEDINIRSMYSVINGALGMAFTGYTLIASFGYLAFSSNQEIKGDILMNFPLSLISQLTKFGFAMTIMISFPLIVFPCRTSLNSLLFTPSSTELHVQEPIPQKRFFIITACIIGPTLTVAILIPQIEVILSLTGATVGVLISYIFPATFFLKVAGSKADFSQKAKVIWCIGLGVMVLSTWAIVTTPSSSHVEPVLVPQQPNDGVIKLPPPAFTVKPAHVQPPERVVHPVEKEPPDRNEPDKPLGIDSTKGSDTLKGEGEIKAPPVHVPDDVHEVKVPKDEIEMPEIKQPEDNIPKVGVGGDGQKQAPDVDKVDMHNRIVKDEVPQAQDKLPEDNEPAAKVHKVKSPQPKQPEKKATEAKVPDHHRAPKDKESQGNVQDEEAPADEKKMHKKFQEDLSKLNKRVEQLEEENKDLKERQHAMEEIKIDEVIKEVKSDLQLENEPGGGVPNDELKQPHNVEEHQKHEEPVEEQGQLDEHPAVDERRVEDRKEADPDGLHVDRVRREEDEQRQKDEPGNNNGVHVDELQEEVVDENEGNIQVGNQFEGQELGLAVEEQNKENELELQDNDKRYKKRDLKVLSEKEDVEGNVNVQQKLNDNSDL